MVSRSRNVAHALSSRPTTAGFGKCSERLSTLVPEEIKEEFERRARALGYPSSSDCLRELLIVWLRGADMLKKVHADRIAQVARNLSAIGSEGSDE